MNLFIDAKTRDLVLDAGEIKPVSGGEDIAQAVRVTLLAWLGEWELDIRHGTDYAKITGDDDITDQEIRDIISAAVYQEPEVQSITALTISRAGREVSIHLAAQLRDGRLISVEVSNSG